jgi:hypothetical protein
VFPLFCCFLSSTLCSYWCIACLVQDVFFCHLPISSFHYFLAYLLQALFVPTNVARDVGPSVNWLPN